MTDKQAESYPVTWLTEDLAVGYAPTSYAQFDAIRLQGIDAILNLCAEFSDLHELEQQAGFDVYYLPVWDEDVPEMDKMEAALAWIDETIYLGKKVLVHCRHGMGRTGTVAAAYLMRRGLSYKAATRKLKSTSASPANYSQWRLVKKYGKLSPALTIREPSLEAKNRVDLTVFFAEYKALVDEIDREIQNYPAPDPPLCGQEDHPCCHEDFHLQFMEVVFLHSKLNRAFSSAKREKLIEKAAVRLKQKSGLCPMNDGKGCEIFNERPIRCRVFSLKEFSSDKEKIKGILYELSQSLFLAFSGRFLPDTEFSFSISRTISGKFIQNYFHYLARLEKE